MRPRESRAQLSPAHRRHVELVAPACALVDIRAFAELQLARKTDAHFAQARPAAGDRDAGPAHARIGLDESLLHLVGCNRDGDLRVEIFRRNFYPRARLADGLE